jgi:hypothetical protein
MIDEETSKQQVEQASPSPRQTVYTGSSTSSSYVVGCTQLTDSTRKQYNISDYLLPPYQRSQCKQHKR